MYFLFYFKQHGYANRTSSHEGARESSRKVEESSQLCSAKQKIKKIAIVHRHFSWESENSDYRKICQSTRSDSRLCGFHRLRISTLANKHLPDFTFFSYFIFCQKAIFKTLISEKDSSWRSLTKFSPTRS